MAWKKYETRKQEIDSLIYFRQFPPLEVLLEISDTGGMVYRGELPFGKLTPSIWLVTSFRLAVN